ncbi:MAG: hypothetical protein GXZ07_03020 [Firmicutes bacterium]|nr:hypothetical protein [Bacillota bacterium]
MFNVMFYDAVIKTWKMAARFGKVLYGSIEGKETFNDCLLHYALTEHLSIDTMLI